MTADVLSNRELNLIVTELDTDQKSIAALFSKDFLNEQATYELSKIVQKENKVNRDQLNYNVGNKKKHKTYF